MIPRLTSCGVGRCKFEPVIFYRVGRVTSNRSLRVLYLVTVMEYAAFVAGVVELGAVRRFSAPNPEKDFRGG
jgi:hypothetical protein